MATALWSVKIDRDGKIRVAHVFFGEDDAEAEANLKAHAEICPKFGPAYKNKETVEIPVELDELPEGDEEEIAAWLDDWLMLDEDEPEAEEEDEDDDEDEEDK
jgi:hypothetical protein